MIHPADSGRGLGGLSNEAPARAGTAGSLVGHRHQRGLWEACTRLVLQLQYQELQYQELQYQAQYQELRSQVRADRTLSKTPCQERIPCPTLKTSKLKRVCGLTGRAGEDSFLNTPEVYLFAGALTIMCVCSLETYSLVCICLFPH